jgi:transcriptional regulator with XRE-family HTH domain
MSSEMSNPKLTNFHYTVKELRKNDGLTQKQVADRIGITYQSYQAYEMGLSLPTLENFLKLCEIFDVTPNDLLNY